MFASSILKVMFVSVRRPSQTNKYTFKKSPSYAVGTLKVKLTSNNLKNVSFLSQFFLKRVILKLPAADELHQHDHFHVPSLTMGPLISIVLHHRAESDTRSDTPDGYSDMLCMSCTVFSIIIRDH